jgi:hypothetical protein
MSPLGTIGRPPPGLPEDEEWAYRYTQGHLPAIVEARIVGSTGDVMPNDGKSVGELEVRGPYITGRYLGDAGPDPERFRDGWLRTGDVGTVSADGYLTLTDRAKDVIKSGGEWISSVELENVLAGHPAVLEACVVGVPDERWGERPLAPWCCARCGRHRRTSCPHSSPNDRPLAAARAVGVHRRGAAHERREVRQEAGARRLRRGHAHRRGTGLMARTAAQRRNRALLLLGLTLAVAIALCAGGYVLTLKLSDLAGCDARAAAVGPVQDDVAKITAVLPDLALPPAPSASAAPSGAASSDVTPSAGSPGNGIVSVHYRWRESRPHTCPDIGGPIGTYYEGFAVLTPVQARALRASHAWEAAAAPDVPAELAQFAPANAAWQRTADLYRGSRSAIWLDQNSDTAYFSYLRG